MGIGIPGLRGGDHVGITVPDMEQAHAFFVDVLGCDYVYSLPEMRHDDDWMLEHLNVDPRRGRAGDPVLPLRLRAELRGLRVRAARPDQRPQPRNSDLGGHHVALYVDDMDAAVALPAREGRAAARRAGREPQRLGRAALAVLPRPVGHAVRAGQLPGRQGVRAGRGREALASRGTRPSDATSHRHRPGYRENVASHRIADSLRTAILDGSYRPGERIRQEDVAARSGASRIPVREALRMLDAEGLVTLVANSGAWVTRLTLTECVELYLIRERLEPLLLRASMPGLDARRDRPAGRAGRRDGSRGRTSTRSCAPTGSSTCPATRGRRRARWGRSSTGCGTRPSTTGASSPRRRGDQDGLSVTHLEHRLLLDCLRRQDADDAERVLVMHIRRTRLELQKHPEIFA